MREISAPGLTDSTVQPVTVLVGDLPRSDSPPMRSPVIEQPVNWPNMTARKAAAVRKLQNLFFIGVPPSGPQFKPGPPGGCQGSANILLKISSITPEKPKDGFVKKRTFDYKSGGEGINDISPPPPPGPRSARRHRLRRVEPAPWSFTPRAKNRRPSGRPHRLGRVRPACPTGRS